MELQYYKFGLNKDIISKFDLIFIPDNFYVEKEKSELYYSHDTIDLLKELKISNLTVGGPTELDFPKKYMDRRNDNYWLGEIYIVSSIVLPIATKLIANFIQKKIDAKDKKATKTITAPTIKIKMKMNNNGKIESVDFDGDGNTLLKILKVIGNNDDQKNSSSISK